jgi:transcriptional regulator with XRE-family HTH domain
MLDVKKFREAHGLTQQDLADKCGVSLRTVQNWEKGKNIPESSLKLLQSLGAGGENVSSFAAENSVSVAAGNGSNVNVGTETERFIAAIERQQDIVLRQLETMAKRDEQIDRLISLLEQHR